MNLLSWIRVKLKSKKYHTFDKEIEELRNEIQQLTNENKILREKFIVFPRKNDDNITIEFFDEDIEDVIIKNIRKAKKEICVAVAWLTSKKLIAELGRIKEEGIEIKIITSDAVSNNKMALESISNGYRRIKILSKKNIMHNKYCVIDNKKVIDGSYNWSKNAKLNLEHIIVIESKVVAKMYKDNFNKIYNNSQYENFEVYNKLG